jgi:cell division control protein 6
MANWNGGESGADSIKEAFTQGSDSPIFQDESIVDPDTVVDEHRIVGRDEQLGDIIDELRPALDGVAPSNMLLFGPSGTGKSLIIKMVSQKLQELAQNKGLSVAVLTIDCKVIASYDRAIMELVEEAARQANVKPGVPTKGVATKVKLDRLFEILNEHFDTVIAVLDEIDKLRNPNTPNDEEPAFSELLYTLSRTNQLADTDTNMCIAALTNQPTFMTELDSRAESSFNPIDIIFHDYREEQLVQILERRRDAFYDGVLKDDVISVSSELAAQDHGDARKAIELVREAGKLAAKKDKGRVSVQDVHEAQDHAERERALAQMPGLSINKQASLYATIRVTLHDGRDLESVPSPVAFDVYKVVSEALDVEPKSRDSFLRYMNELETYGFVRSTTTGRGRGRGSHKEFEVIHDPTVVKSTLESDRFLDEAESHSERIEEQVEVSLDEFFTTD